MGALIPFNQGLSGKHYDLATKTNLVASVNKGVNEGPNLSTADSCYSEG